MAYIYEKNPDTNEIFKRRLGSSKRELITITTIKTDNSMSKVSLYDYLGHAAGSELGQKVATAARQAGVKGEMREVSNPVYKGPVMLWPRAFLDLYFKGGLNEGATGKQLLKGQYRYDGTSIWNDLYRNNISMFNMDCNELHFFK